LWTLFPTDFKSLPTTVGGSDALAVARHEHPALDVKAGDYPNTVTGAARLLLDFKWV
jgi:hypothetical protein